MKKVIVIVVLASVFLSSCSFYTCATYAKKQPEVKAQKATRI